MRMVGGLVIIIKAVRRGKDGEEVRVRCKMSKRHNANSNRPQLKTKESSKDTREGNPLASSATESTPTASVCLPLVVLLTVEDVSPTLSSMVMVESIGIRCSAFYYRTSSFWGNAMNATV